MMMKQGIAGIAMIALSLRLREHLTEKKLNFFEHFPNYLSPPPSPQFGQLVPLFSYVKNDVERVLQNQVTMITTMMSVIIVIIILVLFMILVLKMTKKYHIT